VRLLLDEHFSPRIAEQLRGRGFDVVAVVEQDELRRLADEDLLRWSRANERAIVTENVKDFLPIHGQFLSQGEPHCGIILTSPSKFPRGSAGVGRLVKALARLLESRAGKADLRSDVLWL